LTKRLPLILPEIAAKIYPATKEKAEILFSARYSTNLIEFAKFTRLCLQKYARQACVFARRTSFFARFQSAVRAARN
jgi:hypothetical protein